MVGHGESSTGSYLANPTSPIPSHCASLVVTSTLIVNIHTHVPFTDLTILRVILIIHHALYTGL